MSFKFPFYFAGTEIVFHRWYIIATADQERHLHYLCAISIWTRFPLLRFPAWLLSIHTLHPSGGTESYMNGEFRRRNKLCELGPSCLFPFEAACPSGAHAGATCTADIRWAFRTPPSLPLPTVPCCFTEASKAPEPCSIFCAQCLQPCLYRNNHTPEDRVALRLKCRVACAL